MQLRKMLRKSQDRTTPTFTVWAVKTSYGPRNTDQGNGDRWGRVDNGSLVARLREEPLLTGKWYMSRIFSPRHRIFLVRRHLQYGSRTVLSTPLLREGVPIEVIHIRRTEVRP